MMLRFVCAGTFAAALYCSAIAATTDTQPRPLPQNTVASERNSAPDSDASSDWPKILNIASMLSRDASWSEGVHDAFMEIAFDEPRSGSCEMQGPDPAYVNEMLVRFEEDGSKTYERRVALVVGNSAYENGVVPLKNPSNDATSMARVLRALGFTVHRGIDLNGDELDACLASFNKDLETTPADVALFYYAGHGVQLTSVADNEKRNYMLATDAKVDASGKGKGFKQIDAVLSQMRAHSNQSVFFYDACRNDPLGDDKPQTIDGVAIKRQALIGAASINVKETAAETKAGIYIAYATAPNRVADDAYEENADHSPFTRALLNHIATPGSSLKQAMSYVSNDVGELTDWNQTPWTSSSLTEEVKFNGELAEREMTARSERAAAESTISRQIGSRIESVAMALKGLSKDWRALLPSKVFAKSKAALYRAYLSTNITLKGHTDWVYSASYSPDGKQIITGSSDGIVKLWNVATGTELRSFSVHDGVIVSAKFSPNGQYFLTSSNDGMTKVWTAENAREIRSFVDQNRRLYSATFSPNGKWIVTAGTDGSVKLWDVATGTTIRTFIGHTNTVLATDFSQDGKRLVTGAGDGTARIWSLANGRLLKILAGQQSWIYSVDFSSDGRLIVTAARNGTISLWDSNSGLLIKSFVAHSARVNTAFFSPDDKTILTASADGTAKIWSVETEKAIKTFTGHKNIVSSATFSPDGTQILTSSWDHTARIWAIRDFTQARVTINTDNSLNFATFAHDHSKIVTASWSNDAELWNATNGKRIRKFNGHQDVVWHTDISSDGKRMVSSSADGAIKIWNFSTAAEIDTIRVNNGSVFSAVYSPDNRKIVTTAGDYALVLDLSGRENTIELNGHSLMVMSAAFSQNGNQIVTGSLDKTAKVWSLEYGNEIGTLLGHENTLNSALYSPDDLWILTASDDGTAKLWNASTYLEIMSYVGHQGTVKHASFSPDGSRIVTASDDKTTRIWDTVTGQELVSLSGHKSKITSSSFSQDGSLVLTSSRDNTAKIWDAGLYGPELLQAAYALLTDDLRAEVEHERIRYWEIDEMLLN